MSGEAPRIECPRCGSEDVVPIVYGDPTPYIEHYRQGRIKIGGFLISDDAPDRHCKSCGEQWTAAS